MSEEYEQYRTPGEVTAKSCPVCRGQMTVVTHDGFETWECKNEGCSHSPGFHWTFYRHPRPIVLPLELSSLEYTTIPGHGKYYIRAYCPYCDNPMEIIDPTYGVFNCPNCYKMDGFVNTRMYGKDGKEIEDNREYKSCLDPFPPKVFDDEDEDYGDEDYEDH